MDHLTAYDGDAIRRTIALVLDPSNLASYRSYLRYRLVQSHSSLCTSNLDDEFFDFYQKVLGGQQTQKSNELRSIGTVNLMGGEMMGKLFVARYFPPQCKRDVCAMIDNILGTMRERFNSNLPLKHALFIKISTDPSL